MAKPYKTKDGRWRVEVELPKTADGKRRRKYIYGDTRQECTKAQYEFMQEVEKQSILSNKDITVSQYMKNWLEINCAQLSPTTLDAYTRYVNSYIIPHIGDLKMREIVQMHIQKLLNDFAVNHSSKSCNNLKGILNKAFNDAIINNIIKNNPCNSVKTKQMKKTDYYIYNEDEFNQLLKILNGTLDEIPVVLAALCGLRIGEIMGLTWDNVDFENKKINIIQNAVTLKGGVIIKEPKTYSSNRQIQCPNYVINLLAQHKKDSGYVFPKADSSPESGKNFGKRFQTILKQNKLPHTRFHDLRHFSATMMLKHGISDKEASAILGHSEINMTKKYQHILSSMESRAADMFDTIINKNGGHDGGQNGE